MDRRISETVIALTGPSCVGKSVLARELERRLSCPVRHCGAEVHKRAAELGCGVDALPTSVHREVDAETRRFAETEKRSIIEGRFLEHVLEGVSGVVLIRLECSERVRLERLACRGVGAPSIEASDSADLRTRKTLYDSAEPRQRKGSLLIDTSDADVCQIATTVLEALGGAKC